MILPAKLFLMNFATAFADEAGQHAAGGHHEVVIPWGSLFVQAFNFILLFALLTYLLRKAVKSHFAQRAQTYRELVDRAENARRAAERNHTEMKSKLEKLEASAAQSASQAKAEADQLRTKLVEEAKNLSRKMEQEAQRSAQLELEKAKAALRADLLEKATAATEEKFKKSLGSSDQKKLQNEFAEKIEVVGT
jgi:F-type H+-transporting ATPase subunit b